MGSLRPRHSDTLLSTRMASTTGTPMSTARPDAILVLQSQVACAESSRLRASSPRYRVRRQCKVADSLRRASDPVTSRISKISASRSQDM